MPTTVTMDQALRASIQNANAAGAAAMVHGARANGIAASCYPIEDGLLGVALHTGGITRLCRTERDFWMEIALIHSAQVKAALAAAPPQA